MYALCLKHIKLIDIPNGMCAITELLLKYLEQNILAILNNINKAIAKFKKNNLQCLLEICKKF